MGASHARAYHGDVRLRGGRRRQPRRGGRATRSPRSSAACRSSPTITRRFAQRRPDVVSINTYPETHAPVRDRRHRRRVSRLLRKAAGDHRRGGAGGRRTRHGRPAGSSSSATSCASIPRGTRFVELARTLGKPLVMRMNLNQQSHGATWQTHRNLMASMSPIVDCGVHYVDVMCQMTGARPVRVSAIGARLTDEHRAGHVQLRAPAGRRSTTVRWGGTRPAGAR